jgi:D-amino-acid dehydrogenase
MAGPSADVAIIGSGIVGLSCALHLQRRGRSVLVIDPGRPEARASYGNAGVISRGSLFPVAGPGVWDEPPALRGGSGCRREDTALGVAGSATLGSRIPALGQGAQLACRRGRPQSDHGGGYDAHLDLAEHVGARELIKRNGWLRLYRSEAAWEAASLERHVLAESGVATQSLEGGEIAELEPWWLPASQGACSS